MGIGAGRRDSSPLTVTDSFAAIGALGVVLGMIISGLIITADWRWSFYWSCIAIFPLALSCYLVTSVTAAKGGQADSARRGRPGCDDWWALDWFAAPRILNSRWHGAHPLWSSSATA